MREAELHLFWSIAVFRGQQVVLASFFADSLSLTQSITHSPSTVCGESFSLFLAVADEVDLESSESDEEDDDEEEEENV